MVAAKQGKLVIISGASAGVGKDTILKLFLAEHPDWVQPVSTTTREPRPGEIDGKDMNFVDRATFESWKEQGKFLEAVLVDNNQWYGTLREPVESLLAEGKNVILRIDVRGALMIKELMPGAITVFINADSWEALEERIRARGTEDKAAIERKLELAKTELPYQDKYDHTIVNPADHPEQAVAELE